MKWKKVTLEEIAEIKGGKRLPSGHDFSTVQTSHLYIRARDIGDGKITIKDPVYISEQTANVLRNYTVNENDIVITIVGANIGDIGFITNGFDGANLTENAAKVRVSSQVCNPKFLQLQLATETTKYRFQSIIGGAAQGKLGLFKIKSFEVVLPPLSTQNKIADTLSAYDDLIENNRRRIDLLEQSARMLYKEWFVSLRFPGHEHVKVKDGVPQGWESLTAFEVMEIMSGGTPKTQEPSYWDGDIPFYTPKDYSNAPYVLSTERSITESGLANCNSHLYPKNTIFISARGTVGKIILAQKPMAMSQTSYALSGKNGISPFFLYSALQANLQQFLMRATGAVFSAIVVDTFKNIPFTLPSQTLIDTYEENVTPIFAQIETLLLANERLQQARDLLLPRLMNGEIPV